MANKTLNIPSGTTRIIIGIKPVPGPGATFKWSTSADWVVPRTGERTLGESFLAFATELRANANTGSTERSATVYLSGYTASSPAYQGTAQGFSAITVSQAAGPPTPPPTPTGKTINIEWITGTISNSLSHAVSRVDISNAIVCGDDGQQTGLHTNGSISAHDSGSLYANNQTSYSIVIDEDNEWWEGGGDIVPGESWTFGVDISTNQSGTDVIASIGWNSADYGIVVTPNIYPYVSDGQTLYFIPHVML